MILRVIATNHDDPRRAGILSLLAMYVYFFVEQSRAWNKRPSAEAGSCLHNRIQLTYYASRTQARFLSSSSSSSSSTYYSFKARRSSSVEEKKKAHGPKKKFGSGGRGWLPAIPGLL